MHVHYVAKTWDIHRRFLHCPLLSHASPKYALNLHRKNMAMHAKVLKERANFTQGNLPETGQTIG